MTKGLVSRGWFPNVRDDAVVYAYGRTAAAVSRKLSELLEAVALWLDNSCLTLKINKTTSICFSSGRCSTATASEYYNKKSDLILDAHVKFDKHVKKMSKTVKLNLFTFRLYKCLTFEAAKIYVHAMILSHLGYCITAWSQASPSAVKPLERHYNYRP